MLFKCVTKFAKLDVFAFVVSLIRLSILIEGSVSPGQDCGTGSRRGKIHVMDNGTYRCCLEMTCKKGEYAVLCEKELTEAKCQNCSVGYFMDADLKSSAMKECNQHTKCDSKKHLVVHTPGTSKSDTICACFLEGGYFRNVSDGIKPPHNYQCTSYKECPPGEELNTTGYCNQCTDYRMYKDYHGTGSCQKKKDCQLHGYEFHSLQDTTRDNICKNVTTAAPLFPPSSDRNPMIIIIASVLGSIFLAMLIAVLGFFVHRRCAEEQDSTVSETVKTPPPEDSDTDSGHHSNYMEYARQFSAESVTEEKQLLSSVAQEIKCPPERPHINLPPFTSAVEKSPGITTPDSAFYDGPHSLSCHDLMTDADNGHLPYSTGLPQTCKNEQPCSPGQEVNGKQGTIQVVVTGSHCNVHVGDKVVKNIYNSSEDLDGTNEEHIKYSVSDQSDFNAV